MAGRRPAMRPRPSGGFNPGMGVANEHLDEDAVQAAMQQHNLGQQATNSSGAGNLPSAAAAAAGAGNSSQARSVGSIPQEFQRMGQDVAQGLADFVRIHPQDTPEQQAKKQEMFQRLQKLNQDQQEVVHKKMKAEMESKQQQEQKEQAEAEERKQASQQSFAMPSSPQKGAVGPGGKSKKSQATQQLNQQRQQMKGPSKVN